VKKRKKTWREKRRKGGGCESKSVIRTEIWLHGTKDVIAQIDETSSAVGNLRKKQTAMELIKQMRMTQV